MARASPGRESSVLGRALFAEPDSCVAGEEELHFSLCPPHAWTLTGWYSFFTALPLEIIDSMFIGHIIYSVLILLRRISAFIPQQAAGYPAEAFYEVKHHVQKGCFFDS